MGDNIERKFLIEPEQLPQVTGKRYRQGIVRLDGEQSTRVRIDEDETEGLVVIKGKRNGITRPVTFREIPAEQAKQLLKGSIFPPVEKTRHVIHHNGARWTVDKFEGANSGLWLAEIELDSEDQTFERPPWLRQEVSFDARYYNDYLARNPFSGWPDAVRSVPQPK